MRKRYVFGAAALACLSTLVVLGSSTVFLDQFLNTINVEPLTQLFNSNSAKSETSGLGFNEIVKTESLPDFILWGVIFSFPEKLAARAEKARAEGTSESLFTEYFTRQTTLSIENAEIFKQKAAKYKDEIVLISDRMQQIAGSKKAARQSGIRMSNNEISSIQNELRNLQEARKNTALKYKEEFRRAIDDKSFLDFEQWLKTDFAGKFSSWKTTFNDPKTTPGEAKPNDGFELIESQAKEGTKQ